MRPLKPLRTPYYVPSHAIYDIEKLITRKPTRPKRIRSYKRTTPTKSKVQKNKLPNRIVLKTESKAAVAAEIAKAIKSKAPTIKKEANWSPTSSVLTTPAAQPSIKLTIRLKASKIHSSTEYEIVKLKSEDVI